MAFGAFTALPPSSRGRKVISFGGRKKFGSPVPREVEGREEVENRKVVKSGEVGGIE